MATSGRRTAILVVDDDPHVARSLQVFLRATITDADVVAAGSGTEALEVLGQRPIDLVLSDVQMPDMDGIDLLGRVAQDYPEMPRVLLTGHADVKMAMRAAREAGVVHFFTKPFVPEDVLATVRMLLSEPAGDRPGRPAGTTPQRK